MNVPSQDISQFNILTKFDLSGPNPQICLQADSVGVNQALVKYIYTIKTPSGVIIHEGDATFASPDATGNAAIFCVSLPKFNESIEWSGSDWEIIATMQDTALLEFSQTITAQVCPPRGNNVAGTWYGQSCLAPTVKCDSAEILLSDCTNYDYKALTKTLVSKVMTLIFPADPESGLQPAPVVISGLNDAAIRITYNGNYEARLVTVYNYNAGNGVTITIRYTTYHKNTGIHDPITVECYINVCPLLCEWEALREEVKDLCGVDDVAYTNKKRILDEVTTLIVDVLIRKECGKPIGELIGDIKEISGFSCNCDCDNNGVVPRSLIPTASATYVFSCVTTCGDVVGVFSNPSGNNIVLTLNDNQYVVAIGASMITNGFTITPTLVGCIKTYTLNIDLNVLVTNILAEIDGDVTLKAAFCAIVAQCDPYNPFNGVNLLCVTPTLNNQCDYFAQLSSGQAHHTFDTFNGIEVNGIHYTPPSNWIYTNATQINTWLQTLGFGFGATDYVNSSGTVTLTTLANINGITKLFFKDGVTGQIYNIYTVASNCGSVTSTNKMQAIFTFLCNLNAALFGVSPVLYKVKVNVNDVAPDYLAAKLQSSDSSILITTITDSVINLQALLKTNSADACGGYLLDKIGSTNLVVTNKLVAVTAYTYVITSNQYGGTYNLYTITIDGVVYSINIVSTNLAGLTTALNALGLGTFTVTSPAANLVVTSVGNRYVVNSMVVKNSIGPVFTTFNAVQSTPVSLGNCAKVNVEPLPRTWANITIDGTIFNLGTSGTNEYSSVDSLGNVFINLSAIPLAPLATGTVTLNTVALPVAFRPRTNQFVTMWSGWDGSGSNFINYFEIKTNGFIDVITNVAMGGQRMLINSFYYPTN